MVWVLNPKTGKKPPYNLDGISHFADCPFADRWKGRSNTAVADAMERATRRGSATTADGTRGMRRG